MKARIVIPCLLALIALVAVMVWNRQEACNETTKDHKDTKVQGGTRSVASSGGGDTFEATGQANSRRSDMPVATAAPGSAHHAAAGQAAGTGSASARKTTGTSDQPGHAPKDVATGPSQDIPWHRGEEAVAAVTRADGKTLGGLRLNQVNNFSPVNIDPQETVLVTVTWPQGSPGDKVAAMVEDGGALKDELGMQKDEGQRVLKLALDEKRQMRFVFAGSEASGTFRVTLRKGAEIKTVQFWAGAEPQYVTAAE
jgi:hypothetical protein